MGFSKLFKTQKTPPDKIEKADKLMKEYFDIKKQLAEKIETKKTYISRLENGKADVQLTTLFRIFERLGRRVSLTIL